MDNVLAKRVFACIDNTTLSSTDTNDSVAAFCRHTRTLCLDGNVHVAGVCVYPRFVDTAAAALKGSGIRVVSVAGGFPHGQMLQSAALEEVEGVCRNGADEVDIVMNRGMVLAGRYDEAADEIAKVKAIVGERTLKVILEVCDLPTAEMVSAAAQVAIDGGADFIKTSTGKGASGATLKAAEIMLNCIKENVKKGKKTVGFKAAGGIRKPEEALLYAELARKIMGDEYINSQTFRIGASSLTDGLYSLLTK